MLHSSDLFPLNTNLIMNKTYEELFSLTKFSSIDSYCIYRAIILAGLKKIDKLAKIKDELSKIK